MKTTESAGAYPSTDLLMLKLRLKGIWQRRSLGQHFLTDDAILDEIAERAALDHDTLAIEIGPGPGTLTAKLAARAGRVMAVEFDRRVEALHEDAFSNCPDISFLYNDALKVDLQGEARRLLAETGLGRAVLTGNLPFQITSPLLFRQSHPGTIWSAMDFMVQKEVADRICAGPGGRDFGILTVKIAYFWKVVHRFEVPAAMFTPRPKVDASVVVFAPTEPAGQPTPEEWQGLSPFVDAAFAQRRKMLLNSLAARWPQWPGKEAALEAYKAMGIDPKVRAENLDPAQMRELFGRLSGFSQL